MKGNLSIQEKILETNGAIVPTNFQLGIKIGRAIQVIDQHQIACISSEQKYTKIHLVGTKTPLRTSESLKDLEKRINASMFIRTHRSYIVNIHQIFKIEPSGQTNIVYFRNSSEIAYVSRSFLPYLYERLNLK